MKTNTMLVGTDFSDSSKWAMQHAAEYAKRLNYNMDLVHVTDPRDLRSGAHADDFAVIEHLEDFANELRKEYGIEVTTGSYEGDPGRILGRLSTDKKYVMVAVGYSGKSGVLSRIGSVASKTVRLVDKPILVLVPSHHTTGPVVGCVDFSSGTEKINFWTHCMAKAKDKEPIFVHSAVPWEALVSITPNMGGLGMAETAIERLGGSPEGYYARLEASVRHRLGVGMEGEVDIVFGHRPAKTISEFVENRDASLVVVGRHGHNTIGSRMVGTTAESIFGHSECSTLVIP